MATLGLINTLSHVSPAEGLDITILFPDTGTLVIEQNGRRRLRVDREIGVHGTTVLSSLHGIRQMINIQRAQEADALAQSVDLLAAGDFAVPEQTMRYEVLPHPRCICLFRVDRAILRPIGPNSFDVSIHGTLQPFDLEQAPPYRALSYTRGPPCIDFNIPEPESIPEITSYISAMATSSGSQITSTRHLPTSARLATSAISG